MGWFDRASAKIAALVEDAYGFFIPESFIKAYLKNNLAEVSMKVDPDTLDRFGEGSDGIISGAFIPAFKQIILRDPSNTKVIFHELAHAAQNQPAVRRIKQILADLGDKAFNAGYSFDSYLDDPEEIYARYLAYALTTDHDPRKVMTPADIAQLQYDPQGENTVFTD